MNKTKITATKNGPYKVENAEKITNSKLEILSQDQELWLCRCGGSDNKPFCDGSHKTNGFEGSCQSIEPSKTDTYKGEKITIFDNRTICAHRGYCTDELPKVFTKEEPWINPEGASVEEIMAVCNKCPSGALSYALNDQDRLWGHNEEVCSIRISEKRYGSSGPYDVIGSRDFEGQVTKDPESPFKLALCRCGHSKNKPFCSGEHYNIDFQDPKNE